jgi:hypothetical protein
MNSQIMIGLLATTLTMGLLDLSSTHSAIAQSIPSQPSPILSATAYTDLTLPDRASQSYHLGSSGYARKSLSIATSLEAIVSDKRSYYLSVVMSREKNRTSNTRTMNERMAFAVSQISE